VVYGWAIGLIYKVLHYFSTQLSTSFSQCLAAIKPKAPTSGAFDTIIDD
jgi:hypothetical protein